MQKIILFSSAVFFLATQNIFSQSFEVPQYYQLKVKEDYTPYEKDIIAASKWLHETPLNEKLEKRKKASEFVIKWVNGSPTVNVELNETIFDFEKKNPGMLVLYMAGCAQYVLENNYSKDMRAKHRAALRGMMKVYKSGIGISKDKKMEKLIKSDEQGKLDEWMEENLKMGEK